MIKTQLQINAPYISLNNNLCEISELETECLFGEIFTADKIYENWVWGSLKTDGYKGWIKKKYLSEPIITNYRISSLAANINVQPQIRSNTIFNLSLNALITVLEIEDNWAKIKINKRIYKHNYGFIHTNHIEPKRKIISDWVVNAEKFIGIPYKWGGRSCNGIDCSALLQLSLSAAGINIKRNCSDQIKDLRKYKSNHENFQRGDVFFWKRHVGIGLNPNEIIHSNGFHMKTTIEKREKALERIYLEEGNLIAKYHIPVL
ncbi:C40 family peptidase [Alphaproteobacteria bacterium]|nr:C40 family peptidase [Alphaproteobacteria bacterium]